MSENLEREDYLTVEEASSFRELLSRNWKSYRGKPEEMSNKQWLQEMLLRELPEISIEEAETDAIEIEESITVFDQSLKSVHEATEQGKSREDWLADTIEKASVGYGTHEFGEAMQVLDDVLYHKNLQLEDALARSTDGHIKMSPNLDGNLAEHYIASTTELSAVARGKNIKVEVRDVFTSNSVDVRATNLDTGKYQNYQLKFGKDAKATIDLIERGNYNNQQIVVPKEQVAEVQAHFQAKGSQKTITDTIDAFGAKGKSFSKEDMKTLQIEAQKTGQTPTLDYNHYQSKDLALSIGKNASAMALQSAAISTGMTLAMRVCNGEQVDSDQLVEVALHTGADTGIKTVTAGTLQVAIRKGIIKCIPVTTPAGVIANIACVGIENAKILSKIASGEISSTKGLDQMGRTTTAMVGGLVSMGKLASVGTALGAIGGPVGAVIGGLIGGTVGYFAGSKVGDMVYSGAKKVVSVAKSAGKAVMSGIKSAGRAVSSGIKSAGRAVASFFR